MNNGRDKRYIESVTASRRTGRACVCALPQLCTPEASTASASTHDTSWECCHSTGHTDKVPVLAHRAEPLASKERYARPGIFYPNTVSCSEPTEYSTVKEPVGEPSLSSGEECLSLRRKYSTLQDGCQYGSIVA